MGSYSEFLFARSDFWSGMARVLDMGCPLNVYNTSRDGWEADRRALASDWAAVGDDFRTAIVEMKRRIEESRVESIKA